MAVFSIKARDTRPILEVALKNPDGSAHDLTGATTFTLYIRKDDGTVLTRAMVKEGLDTAGILRYTWLTSDWDTGNLPIPSSPWEVIECPMEYEVVAGSSRMTFPNDGYDKLHILGDLT
jgi:hypothetical protein